MRFTFILFLTNAILFDRSRGSGPMYVCLSHYNNSEGLENQGYCCDGTAVICNGGNRCDHYFIICLDRSRKPNNDINQCEIGRYTTGTTNGKNVISFGTSIGGISNPKKLRFQKWQNNAVIKVEVWDHDINADDFVDRFTTSVNINASNFWAEMKYQSFNMKTRTQLAFKMAVVCDENWYGPHCDIYCNPSLGNYSCAANGRKVCASGATCENQAHEETGSPESQAENYSKVTGITMAVVLVIVVFAVAVVLIARKIYQRRQKQPNDLLNEDHGDLAVYYTAEPVQSQHVTEDNVYYNGTCGDAQNTSDTDASSRNNTSGNTPSGGKSKNSDEIDTVKYANAICVRDTGDVYAVVNK